MTLLNRVVVFDQGADQGMADFVISDQTLAATVGERTTLHAGDDPIHSVVDLAQADGFLRRRAVRMAASFIRLARSAP